MNPKFESKLHLAVNVLLLLGGVWFLAGGAWAMFNGSTGHAALGGAGGLVLLLSSTVDRFEFLKGWGMEAKTRRLDEKIDRAEEILGRLKRLAEVSGGASISAAARAGRFDSSTPPREFYELAQALKDMLASAGSTEMAIRDALEPWARMSVVDLLRSLHRKYYIQIDSIFREMEIRYQQIPKPIDPSDLPGMAIQDERKKISDYKDGFLKEFGAWPLHEIGSRLRAENVGVPAFIPVGVAAALKTDVNRWAAEIDYLAEKYDFRDREMWFSALDSPEA